MGSTAYDLVVVGGGINLIYDYLIERWSQDVAQGFANANENGINEIENLSKELSIDCDMFVNGKPLVKTRGSPPFTR